MDPAQYEQWMQQMYMYGYAPDPQQPQLMPAPAVAPAPLQPGQVVPIMPMPVPVFRPGELAWVKAYRYPFWPALIVDPNALPAMKDLERRPNYLLAFLFGSHDYVYVSLQFALPWHQYYADKSKKSRAKLFMQALNEASMYATRGLVPQNWNVNATTERVRIFTEAGDEVPRTSRRQSKPPKAPKEPKSRQAQQPDSQVQTLTLIKEHTGDFKPLTSPGNSAKNKKRKERQLKVMQHLALAPFN